MAQDQYITGIDIGSTAVRIVVGQRLTSADGGKESVHIIGAVEASSEGVNRGVINSIEDAVSSVSACIERAERMTGTPVGSSWVAISGSNIMALESKGVAAVARTDGEIREDDVERAVDSAQAVATPVNYEIIHVIPKTFSVDDQAGVKDPVGMTGFRLEVDAQIIHGLTSHIKNLTKCVYRTGVNIEHLVLGILASAEVVATPKQKELGVAVINIGASSTSVAVFEQGDIIHIATVPLGSDHVTADIAIGLRTSIETAEAVKRHHAQAVATAVPKREEIDLSELGGAEDEAVSKRYVAQIVQARLEEILELVDRELKKCDRSGMLPAGVIITGGGAKIPGLVDLTKKKLRLPASLGYPVGLTSISDRVSDLAFTTAIGLVQWGSNESSGQSARRSGLMNRLKPVGDVSKKIKKFFGLTA